MADDKTYNILASIRASASEFSSDMKSIQRDSDLIAKSFKPITKGLEDIGDAMTAAGKVATVGLTLPIVAMGTYAVAQFNESAKAAALMTNAIRSTGGAAGKSAEDLTKMATALEANSVFNDDEIIAKVSTQLLTFTKISGPAFDGAAQAALNMSTVLGQDLQSSAIQVGKALNDPVAGVTALQRVGVKLTETQKDQVKAFMDVNDIASAQNIILKELETEFGGAAKAASEVGSGPMTQLANQLGNLAESWGGLIQNAITPFIAIASDLVKWLDTMDSSTKTVVLVIAAVAAAIGPVLLVLGTLAGSLANMMLLYAKIAPLATAANASMIATGAAAAAAMVGVAALGAAIGVGIGMLINWAIEGTRVQKWIDSFTDKLARLAGGWSATKEAEEIAAFTANAHVTTLNQQAQSVDTVTGAIGPHVAAIKTHEAATKAVTAALKEQNLEDDGLIAAMYAFYLAEVEADKEQKESARLLQDMNDKMAIAAPLNVEMERSTRAWKVSMEEAGKPLGALNEMLPNYADLVGIKVPEANAGAVASTKAATTEMSRAWDTAMGNVTSGLSKAFTDAITGAGNFKDTMIATLKTAAKGMLDSLMAGFLTPFTTALGTIGGNLASVLTGGVGAGGKGGLAGIFGGLGGLFGGGGGAGAGTAAGGTAGAGGLGAAGAFMTNPWTIAIGAAILGGIAITKSQAHHEANTFVQEFQNPFNDAIAKIHDAFYAAAESGNLTIDAAEEAKSQVEALWASFKTQATEFASHGKDEALVVSQAFATVGANWGTDLSKITGGMGDFIDQLKTNADDVTAALKAVADALIATTAAAKADADQAAATAAAQKAGTATNPGLYTGADINTGLMINGVLVHPRVQTPGIYNPEAGSYGDTGPINPWTYRGGASTTAGYPSAMSGMVTTMSGLSTASVQTTQTDSDTKSLSVINLLSRIADAIEKGGDVLMDKEAVGRVLVPVLNRLVTFDRMELST